MPKYPVLFTMTQACSCVVEADDRTKAWGKVQEKTWQQLKDSGYDPQVDSAYIDPYDRAEVCEVGNTEDI